MADKRFSVEVLLRVMDTTGEEDKEFFESSILYHDAQYDVVLAVEGILLEAQAKLAAMGYEHAEKKGLPVPNFGKKGMKAEKEDRGRGRQ